MDDKLTKLIQTWLATDTLARDIREGADLLLRLNRNRILYNNILRRPDKMASKLEYELKKHLRIRLDGLTLREVNLLESSIIPAADKTLREPAPDSADLPTDKSGIAAPFRGRRADHDALPDEVRQLYERNGEVFRKLRQVRETLRSMHAAEPCDRYEYCKLLGELDREYHANWERYDHYVAEDGGGDALIASNAAAKGGGEGTASPEGGGAILAKKAAKKKKGSKKATAAAAEAAASASLASLD